MYISFVAIAILFSQAMKSYQQYHGESKQAETKLRFVEQQKQKIVEGSKQGTMSKKAKQYEKQADKV